MIIQVALRNKAKESATILSANPKYLALSKNFREANQQLTGSSPEMLIDLVNSSLLPKDARIAIREDLENAIKTKNDFLSNVYVDFALNLDSRDSDYKINSVYAGALAKDLKSVGINLKNAKLIPYNILTKEFRLFEKGKDIIKTCIQNTDDIKWDYMPNSSGLFRACRDRSGDWYCRSVDLAYSNEYSRVVVISGEASSQIFFEDYASKFEKERDKTTMDAKIIANKNYADKIASLRTE